MTKLHLLAENAFFHPDHIRNMRVISDMEPDVLIVFNSVGSDERLYKTLHDKKTKIVFEVLRSDKTRVSQQYKVQAEQIEKVLKEQLKKPDTVTAVILPSGHLRTSVSVNLPRNPLIPLMESPEVTVYSTLR